MVKNYPIQRDGDSTDEEYTDVIVPVKIYENGEKETREFKGDYYGDRNLLDSSEDYKLFRYDGYQCIFSVKQEFSIEQDFYGENKERTVLSGYGFYYRPINPNEPFPSGLEIDSFWYDVYGDNNKVSIKGRNNLNEDDILTVINLDDSFKEVTYSTQNITRNEIKNSMGSKSNYTSWDDIESKTGKSSFVSELGLRQNVETKCVYPLGCGPSNLKRADDTTSNWCPTFETVKGCGE